MFESLCKKLNIGNFIEYEKLTGGITNEVYKVITDNDIFVIKKIKDIDEEHIRRLEFSENISNKAKKQGLNVINALKFDNKYVQKVDDNYFLLYKFFPGKVYLTREINLDNVRSVI